MLTKFTNSNSNIKTIIILHVALAFLSKKFETIDVEEVSDLLKGLNYM